MRAFQAILFVVALTSSFTACVTPLSWDPVARTPEPLALPVGGDANSAFAYYQLGLNLLESDPLRAADAFHYASRLDPLWGTPIYARRIALFLSNMSAYERYTRGERWVVQAPGVVRLDSLYLRALVLNPFLPRTEDAHAVREVIVYRIVQDLQTQYPTATIDEGRIRYELDIYLQRADEATRAWLAQSEGRYVEASGLYRKALERRSATPYMRADLARVLLLAGRAEESRTEMLRALAELRERDEDELVRVYESKALYEHSVGLILESLQDTDGARSSYSRALEEDLSFHPAHVRLAELALLEGDTLTAISEIGLAAEIRPDDPGVHFARGRILESVSATDEAADALRRAIELEPLFAAPYLALGRVLEERGETGPAAEHYRTFLQRAALTDDGRGEASSRLARLEQAAGGSH